MTAVDTSALRALADRADRHDSWRIALAAALDPDTVRALCDAADEVERLTSKYEEWESMHSACIALREDVARHERESAVLNESIGRHRRDLDAAGESLRRVAAERDAARTAHAALVADLRALHFDDCGVCPVCTDDMLESVPFPCPTADALDAACAEVDGTAMEVERLLAAHEAEVRAKVAAEIEAEARQVLTDDGAGQFERAGLLLAARIANPTTTEAAFTATCVPAGCSCDCHRWPGVSHLVACCSQPPFALANPTTTEADA